MIVATNMIAKLLRQKWDLKIDDDDLILLTFDYNYKLPLCTTELESFKRVDDQTVDVRFTTSFGIFHQPELSYNDIVVVLFENINGSLAEQHKDLIISALTYPEKKDRRTLSCGNSRNETL